MTYLKLGVSDNAVGNLDAGISAVATSAVLEAGDGALFPAGQQFVGTLVQYTTTADPTSGIVKSEKVLVTVRSTDTLTITRGYDGDTGTTFDAGDYFYLNVTALVISDIQDEASRLETDKLDVDGELRTGNGAWKVPYNDGSGDETELALGTSGQVLSSNGSTSAPTFETPTVDINSLAEKTTVANDDYIIMYDTTGGANKKHLAEATESSEGLVEKTTDAEALAKVDTVRYASIAQIDANFQSKTNVLGDTTAFDTLAISEIFTGTQSSGTTGNLQVDTGIAIATYPRIIVDAFAYLNVDGTAPNTFKVSGVMGGFLNATTGASGSIDVTAGPSYVYNLTNNDDIQNASSLYYSESTNNWISVSLISSGTNWVIQASGKNSTTNNTYAMNVMYKVTYMKIT